MTIEPHAVEDAASDRQDSPQRPLQSAFHGLRLVSFAILILAGGLMLGLAYVANAIVFHSGAAPAAIGILLMVFGGILFLKYFSGGGT